MKTIVDAGGGVMSKITFFIPYPEMRKVVEQTFNEQRETEWQLEVVLATGVRKIDCLVDNGSDVIVARGVTAAALKRLLPDIPVVDLPVSGYDIMRAACECRKRFAAGSIGIVGSKDMIYGAKSIESLMDIKLAVIEVQDENDAEPSIQQLKANGIDVMVGGVMSTQIAQRLGLKTVFIQTGQEAIYQSLREAQRVVKVKRQEQERSEEFRAILNYSTEGIVAVDAMGNIKLVNAAAKKMTSVRDETVGQQVSRLLPELGLERVLTTGKALLGEVEAIKGQQVAVNRVPIKVGNQTVGAVATFQPVTAIQELEGKIRQKIYKRGHVARLCFEDVLGESQAIRNTVQRAKEFSQVSSNILITGETGTGKEIFAQSIHNASNRNIGPFVAVNCAALPENLLESELFGYAEGAFTGAVRGGKMGLFEQAHGGTIFLDEISEISPKLQGRLLRVLQEREIMRLGDDRVIPVDVRIIAATNRDLYTMMQTGVFRDDLYYRVNVLRLELPPLRERRDDIIPLMLHFLGMYTLRSGKPPRILDDQAQAALIGYRWPGNVRELRNFGERLAVLNNDGVIGAKDIAGVLPINDNVEKTESKKIDLISAGGDNANKTILLKALEEADYHYGRAAARLGISRVTLWRRLKQYNMLK